MDPYQALLDWVLSSVTDNMMIAAELTYQLRAFIVYSSKQSLTALIKTWLVGDAAFKNAVGMALQIKPKRGRSPRRIFSDGKVEYTTDEFGGDIVYITPDGQPVPLTLAYASYRRHHCIRVCRDHHVDATTLLPAVADALPYIVRVWEHIAAATTRSLTLAQVLTWANAHAEWWSALLQSPLQTMVYGPPGMYYMQLLGPQRRSIIAVLDDLKAMDFYQAETVLVGLTESLPHVCCCAPVQPPPPVLKVPAHVWGPDGQVMTMYVNVQPGRLPLFVRQARASMLDTAEPSGVATAYGVGKDVWSWGTAMLDPTSVHAWTKAYQVVGTTLIETLAREEHQAKLKRVHDALGPGLIAGPAAVAAGLPLLGAAMIAGSATTAVAYTLDYNRLGHWCNAVTLATRAVSHASAVWNAWTWDPLQSVEVSLAPSTAPPATTTEVALYTGDRALQEATQLVNTARAITMSVEAIRATHQFYMSGRFAAATLYKQKLGESVLYCRQRLMSGDQRSREDMLMFLGVLLGVKIVVDYNKI